MIYALIAYVVGVLVGILVGYSIGRRRGIDGAMKAARAEIATMQGERLQRAEARLKEALERVARHGDE